MTIACSVVNPSPPLQRHYDSEPPKRLLSVIRSLHYIPPRQAPRGGEGGGGGTADREAGAAAIAASDDGGGGKCFAPTDADWRNPDAFADALLRSFERSQAYNRDKSTFDFCRSTVRAPPPPHLSGTIRCWARGTGHS